MHSITPKVRPFNPGVITNGVEASGGSGGTVVYQWQQSSDNINFTDIPGNTMLTYDPPSLTQTTYFRRATKRKTCTLFLYALSITITVNDVSSSCPTNLSFQRHTYTNAACNGAGDYYFEVILSNVVADDMITLAGLPANGVNIALSSLNGIAFSVTTFLANMQYINSSSFRWPVDISNGASQTLRISYCWVNTYPNPVSLTTATSLCSGITTSCVASSNIAAPGSTERGLAEPSSGAFGFTAAPNPGTDHLLLTYFGNLTPQMSLCFFAITGQMMSSRYFSEMEDQQQWEIEINNLPPGIYFIRLQTNNEVRFQQWEKL